MRTLILSIVGALALTGCTSQAVTDRLDSLESELARVQQTADQARDLAQEAKSDAGAASEAAAKADRALRAANEASQRAERIAETCCARK